MLVYLKPLQRYYKKCTYASKVRKLFAKKIDFIYLIRYTALAQAKLESEVVDSGWQSANHFCK